MLAGGPAIADELATGQALALLARRPYSVAELRRALEKKLPAEDLSQVLARLRQLSPEEMGALAGHNFAQFFGLA